MSLTDVDLDLSVELGDLSLHTALGEEDFGGDTELEDFCFFTGDGEQECDKCFLLCSLAAVGLTCDDLLTDPVPGLLSYVGHGCISDLEAPSRKQPLSSHDTTGKLVVHSLFDTWTSSQGFCDSCTNFFLLSTPSISLCVSNNLGLLDLDFLFSCSPSSMVPDVISSRIIIF